jgi:hypothetical protein
MTKSSSKVGINSPLVVKSPPPKLKSQSAIQHFFLSPSYNRIPRFNF